MVDDVNALMIVTPCWAGSPGSRAVRGALWDCGAGRAVSLPHRPPQKFEGGLESLWGAGQAKGQGNLAGEDLFCVCFGFLGDE